MVGLSLGRENWITHYLHLCYAVRTLLCALRLFHAFFDEQIP